MDNFLKRLRDKNMVIEIKEGGNGTIVFFPTATESGVFIIGQIVGNEFTLEDRIGMESTEYKWKDINTIPDEDINCIYKLYIEREKDIEFLKRYM